MQVERGRFLLAVSTLAAGAAGGYLASEKNVVPHLSELRGPTIQQESTPPPPAEPEVTGVAQLTAAEKIKPACDDSITAADIGDCPAVGLPTEEGGSGGLAAARCADFKKTMKPRVAAAAVACLKHLSPAEQADPKRVDLCGHNALMNACDDSSAESVTQTCAAIANACPGTSKQECGMAMSGLREIGRESLLDCTRAHCTDKGLVGCEGVGPAAK